MLLKKQMRKEDHLINTKGSAAVGVILFLFFTHALSFNVVSASPHFHSDGDSTSPPPSNSPEQRLDQVKKDLDTQQSSVSNYVAFARKLLLEKAHHVRVFTMLLNKFNILINKLYDSSVFDPSNGQINATVFLQLENKLKHQVKAANGNISEANESFYTEKLKIQKLKDKIFALNDQLSKQKKAVDYTDQTAAKSLPRSIHCLTMRLLQERMENPDKYKYMVCEGLKPVFENPDKYHYAIFSDNVLAASVVVNSVVKNAKEPWKHVLHVVTDKVNLHAMQVMFKSMEYRGANVEVKAVEDYRFLNSSYVPVLRQLESTNMHRFYFGSKVDNSNSRMKFRNPKYMSILNHLRFYLPEMYPKLNRILFLDDDVVVQKDLTGLWEVDMNGKVNGAVQTCIGSFHRYSQYMNFSHPLIREKFDPNACAFAYGMNFFDLDAWRTQKSTEEYHYWQNQNENRTLWKLGTLPPGLITFYSTTRPLNKSWHVLGLGYNPGISMEEIQNAAVIHYNGNAKPWLDIAIPKFRSLWTKYVDYRLEFIQGCDFDFL